MSFRPLNEKLVNVRKPHRCVWCGEHIQIGQTAFYRAYVFDQSFMSDYLHPECMVAMMHSEYLDEGFEAYSFKRGLTDAESEVAQEEEGAE